MKRFMHMRQQSRNYFLRFHDQWVMVFEAGFRVDFVIVFVIVLLSFCVAYILPIHVRGTHDYLICSCNARGVSTAAFSLGNH